MPLGFIVLKMKFVHFFYLYIFVTKPINYLFVDKLHSLENLKVIILIEIWSLFYHIIYLYTKLINFLSHF